MDSCFLISCEQKGTFVKVCSCGSKNLDFQGRFFGFRGHILGLRSRNRGSPPKYHHYHLGLLLSRVVLGDSKVKQVELSRENRFWVAKSGHKSFQLEKHQIYTVSSDSGSCRYFTNGLFLFGCSMNPVFFDIKCLLL